MLAQVPTEVHTTHLHFIYPSPFPGGGEEIQADHCRNGLQKVSGGAAGSSGLSLARKRLWMRTVSAIGLSSCLTEWG